MSKILVLGRTMDMGGTGSCHGSAAAETGGGKDVTLLLVRKKRRSAGADSEGSGSASDDLEQKPHPALERIVGKRETPAERSFYARGMGVFLMRVVYGKKRYGKLYERILECVEPETKQYDLVFDFFRIRCVHNRIRSQKDECAEKKRSGFTEKISGGCSGPGTLFRYDKIYCVSEPVRKQVIARFPELADRTEVLLNFIDIKQVQRRE